MQKLEREYGFIERVYEVLEQMFNLGHKLGPLKNEYPETRFLSAFQTRGSIRVPSRALTGIRLDTCFFMQAICREVSPALFDRGISLPAADRSFKKVIEAGLLW